MKLKALTLVCVATLFIQSCTTNEQVVSKSLVQKRKYLKGWNLRNLNQKSFEIAGKQLKKNKNYPTRLHENLASQLELLALVNNELLEHTRVGQMAEPNPALQSNRVDTSSCDILILQNGVELEVKVSEISDELIKFKMCDNLNGPQISKKSTDVYMIKYPNGSKTIISELISVDKEPEYSSSEADQNGVEQNNSPGKKIHPLGLTGVILSLLGIFVAAVILGSMACIFGIISIAKIDQSPDKWKGKGFAIASILLGFAVTVLGVIAISMA